jgi:quinol monooxygenase YgiN
MTILIAGTIEITNGKRGQAINDATSVMIDIRQQTGCNHYVWSADPTSDSRVYVFEDWDNTAVLSEHFSGPNFAKMFAVLANYDVEDISVQKYKIALAEPITDNDGNPRADFFTE